MRAARGVTTTAIDLPGRSSSLSKVVGKTPKITLFQPHAGGRLRIGAGHRDYPHHPFNFVRTSYTVTRDGPRVDVNRSENSHQNASRTDAYSTSSNELNHSQMLSAHAFRDSGRISTSCDNRVPPKPSELKPRQLKRKRKQEAPVVLDHLAQLRRKQHGFETGEFNRHHGDFFGGCQPSQTSTGEDLDVQAVPCSPNLKRVRPAGSVYDAVETANSGYRSFSMGEPSKFSLPAAAMEFSTTPTQQSSSSSSKPTSEFQPLTSIYSGIHFSGTEQVPRGYSNEPLYSASTFSTGSKSDSTRFVLKTAPVEMDCTTARSMNVSVQDVFVTSVEQPHCSYSRPHQLWSRHQRLDDCIVPLSSSADTGHASRVTEKSCNSLSSAISESGAVFPTLLAPSQDYPRGQSDNQLTREPPKPKPRPGEKKMYDSVKGNLSGGDEYVVYNPYRVLPEYIIEYSITTTPCNSQPNCLVPAFQPVGITQTLALGMALSKSRLKTPSGGKTKSGKKTPSGGKKKNNSKTKAPFRSGGSCSGKHSIPLFPPASNPSLPGGSNYNPPMNSVTGGVGSSVQPTTGVIFPSPSVQTSNTQTGTSSATSFLSHPASQVLPPPLPAVPAVPNVPPVCLSRSQLVALYSNIKKAVLQSMDNQSQ